MSAIQTIQSYEQAGDYANALRVAREEYDESLKTGLEKGREELSTSMKHLEKELLTAGALRRLFDENAQPKATLLQLLDIVGMEKVSNAEKAVVQINQWAQENLLRKGERWEEQTKKFEELKPKIKPLLTELGFVAEVLPSFKEYKGSIIHGGLLPRVVLRLQYLVEQWQQGIRFSHLYFLSGERPLEAQHESKESFIKQKVTIKEEESFPKTECEMIQLVWEKSEIPEDMRKEVKVQFVNAPMVKDAKPLRAMLQNRCGYQVNWIALIVPANR